MPGESRGLRLLSLHASSSRRDTRLSAILVHWYTEKRQQLVKITFFLFSRYLLLFRCFEVDSIALKSMLEIYINQIGTFNHRGVRLIPPGRQSDRGTPCMFMRQSERGKTWDPHPAPTRPNTMSMRGVPRSKLPALMGHPDPPMVVFSNLVDIYLQHTF